MSSPTESRAETEARYAEAARAYLRRLTLEHHMEAIPQATQREITLESFALVKAARRDVHVFNELLVQYPRAGKERPGQVVPDNMVVIHAGPIHADGSYNLPDQPAGPLFVLEYVSKGSQRKDYEDNFDKYERDLKVPYYLVFYPDTQDLTLYHLDGGKYLSVKPNEQGRLAIPELELEVALHDNWARFWFRGALLPLPADLQRELDEKSRRLAEETRRADDATRRAEEAERRAAQERRRADEERRSAEDERRARLAAEEELARLRAQLSQRSGGPDKGN
jgi:Uma2 family endonuclease